MEIRQGYIENCKREKDLFNSNKLDKKGVSFDEYQRYMILLKLEELEGRVMDVEKLVGVERDDE